MLAAFSATLGVIAALFLGFLIFRFWRVTLALLALALIGVAGVIGYIYYEDARTARILAERRADQQAKNERMDLAAKNRNCGSLPASEMDLCQILVKAKDGIKAAAEAAKKPADYQYPPEVQPDPAPRTNTLEDQSVEEFLKTLVPKAN